MIRRFNEIGVVKSVAFSPDGRTVLTGNAGGTISLWDIRKESPIQVFKEKEKFRVVRGVRRRIADQNAMLSVKFSPDGLLFVSATGNGRTAIVWDIRTGRELMSLSHTRAVSSAVFSPDGRTVLTVDDRNAFLWDLSSGKMLRTFKHKELLYEASFSPDGNFILTRGWEFAARLWNVRTGKEELTISGHESPLQAASFTSDGRRILTASSDGTAILWELLPQ